MPLERVLPPKKRLSYRLLIETQQPSASGETTNDPRVVTIMKTWRAVQIEPLQDVSSNDDGKPIDLTTPKPEPVAKKPAPRKKLPVQPSQEVAEPIKAAAPAPFIPPPAVAGPSGLCKNKENDENEPVKKTKQRATKSPRNHECDTCHKTFVQRSSLTTHKRIHTGEKPLQCEHCPRRFGDASTHKKHLRTHTNEKPYTCRVCFKIFSQSGNCLRHERGLHPKEYALLPKKTKSRKGAGSKK